MLQALADIMKLRLEILSAWFNLGLLPSSAQLGDRQHYVQTTHFSDYGWPEAIPFSHCPLDLIPVRQWLFQVPLAHIRLDTRAQFPDQYFSPMLQ